MNAEPVVTRIGNGVYRVEVEGRGHIVHLAGTPGNRWVHWNGHVFHNPFDGDGRKRAHPGGTDPRQSLSAPMPATVLKVLVEAGRVVRRGDILIILEAMKMELPLRSGADAVVRAVRCREGELVQPGAILVELE